MKQGTKIILISLCIIIVEALIGYLQVLYFDYQFKHHGISTYGSISIIVLLFIIIGIVFEKNLFTEEYKKKNEGLCALLCIFLTGVFIVPMALFVNKSLTNKVANALEQHEIAIGIVTQKEKKSHSNRKATYYFIWAGINDTITSRHVVSKKIYDSKEIHDTVILKISTQYPCINKVINWNPKPKEIEKIAFAPILVTPSSSSEQRIPDQ